MRSRLRLDVGAGGLFAVAAMAGALATSCGRGGGGAGATCAALDERAATAPAGAPVDVTVTLDAGVGAGRLGPGFLGLSFETSHLTDAFLTPRHQMLVKLLALLGRGVLRIGANDVDRSRWLPSAPYVAPGTTSSEVGTAAVDDLAALLRATGWSAIYGLNLATSTPDAAVAEATYVAERLGSSLRALEIGNELNFYGGGYATTRQRWVNAATSVRAALPGWPLAGPATAGEPSWATRFAADEASLLGLLTHHYYRGHAASEGASCAQLLATDAAVAAETHLLVEAARANGLQGGFVWDEVNSFAGHGLAGVSDTFAAALWALDFMLTAASQGARGVAFHGGGQNMDGNVCPDGVASCTRPFRYSPLVEVDSQVVGVAPLFYAMLLVAQLGSGEVTPLGVAPGLLPLSAYAVLPNAGNEVAPPDAGQPLAFVFVNKDPARAARVAVARGREFTDATVIALRAPGLAATTAVTLADASVTAEGTWAPSAPSPLPVSADTLRVEVPAASALLVRAH